MKLVFKLGLLFVLTSVLVFGQRRVEQRQARTMVIDKEVPQSVAKSYHPTGTMPRVINSPATYVLVDSMTNIFGFYSEEIHPIYYSPGADMITVFYRGDVTSYAPSSGSLYYSRSTNGGATWTRCTEAFNGQDQVGQLGRYPSASIYYNSNVNDYYEIAAWPNLNPDAFGDIGYGGDFPLGGCSPFGERVVGNGKYDVGQPTWSSDQQAMWVARIYPGGFYGGTEFWRTSDFSSPTNTIPPAMDTLHTVNPRNHLGGDWIKVGSGSVMAYGYIGTSYRVYHDDLDSAILTPSTIHVIYSTDHGATWSDLDTVNLESITALGDYVVPWSWSGSLFASPGHMVLDSLGYPHVFLGLQKEDQGEAGSHVVVAEVYKDGSGWQGRIIATANPATAYLRGQTGYMPKIARNEEGTFFVVQWIDSKYPDGNADLFIAGKYWHSINWIGPVNITQTPTNPEYLAMASPRLRRDGDSLFTFFSCYAIPKNLNDPGASPNRTYIYVGTYQFDLTPINYDVSVVSIDAPTVGVSVTEDSSFTQFKATFRNNGELPQPDSIDVKFRVLNPAGSEVGSATLKIKALGIGESYTATFPLSSIGAPLDLGTYTFQAINLTSDQVASNDTAVGFVKVVIPGSISYITTTISAVDYPEITDGTELNYVEAGNDTTHDDAYEVMALPFPFVYNGVEFDSIKISTNGFIQLGKAGYGRDSVPYGIEDNSSIDYNENGRLYVTAPRNSFSAWWEDLAVHKAGDPNAGVFYKTEGTSPNRVFIVQWKSMLAYYDAAATTARVNFQVRMYEKKNTIEFYYGDVQPGTWAGTDVGAMIGFKDETGGDYHFYDVVIQGSGQARNGTILYNTNIEAVWPGPDTMYSFEMQTVANTVNILNRWNLVSVPLVRSNNNVLSVFPSALSNTTFSFEPSGYQPATTLTPGRGYWTKFPEAQNQIITGSSMPTASVTVNTGWNLIGSVDHDIAAVPVGVQNVVSQTFGYNNGYFPTTTIKPGKGYWVKVSASGSLNLGSVSLPKETPVNLEKVSSVTIVDNQGRQQKLYVTADAEQKINLDMYEMPPLPPTGEFDARFATGRILETYRTIGDELPVILSSPQYPITLSYDVKEDGYALAVEEVSNGKVVATHVMDGSGTVKIKNGSSNTLVIKIVNGSAKPKEFALGQNYPNPFNPTTRFNVDLPKDAFVSVVVYDILGRKVATLMNGNYQAGYHTVEWNSTNDAGLSVPSGIYFVRMTSEQFTAVRKMMLLK